MILEKLRSGKGHIHKRLEESSLLSKINQESLSAEDYYSVLKKLFGLIVPIEQDFKSTDPIDHFIPIIKCRFKTSLAVSRNINKTFFTDKFSTTFPEGSQLSNISRGSIKPTLIIAKNGLRTEVCYTHNSGCSPYNAINFDLDGKTYPARNSFLLRKESVKGNSIPWLKEEEDTADFLRGAISQKISPYHRDNHN